MKKLMLLAAVPAMTPWWPPLPPLARIIGEIEQETDGTGEVVLEDRGHRRR